MRPLIAAAAVLLGAGVLMGAAFGEQTILGKSMVNPNAPIDITANQFDVDANTKTGVYSGNVIIHQGEVSMRANTVRALLVNDKPSRITAQGKVVVDAPSGIATGDNGVYDVDPRIIVLTGNVVLTKDKNVMRGKELVVNLITGVAKLNGGEGKDGRIRALFSNDKPSDTQKP
jgi:lipopolysaccharide transport periplasmic protein LptA